jgi:hypothetical protein
MTTPEQRAEWREAAEAWGPKADGLSEERLAHAVLALLDELEAVERDRADLVSEGIRQKRRANDALAERDSLRAEVEALASSYAQYETDVWAEDVAANLRALLAGDDA